MGNINVQKFWLAATNLPRLSRLFVGTARDARADHDRIDRRSRTSSSVVKRVKYRVAKAWTSTRALFSCCGYPQLVHRAIETDQDRIVNLRLSGRHGRRLVSQFRNTR
jgi:hypothetical protein